MAALVSPCVFGTRGEDHHEVDLGIRDEVVVVVERVPDPELRDEAVGGRVGAAGQGDDLEVVQGSQGGKVTVLGPATAADDPTRIMLLMNCPCVRRAGVLLLVRRAGLSAQERGLKMDGVHGTVLVEGGDVPPVRKRRPRGT
ncbi:MAG TPA: hypothetical protein VNT24_03535 [Propionibacteriaceae bacterium]|nr:hypothetical protein [Propionibacteriaceae bacterium]